MNILKRVHQRPTGMTEGLDHLSLEKSDRAGTPQPREQMVQGGSCQ